MRNPFIGMTAGAWSVFAFTLVVAEFPAWAWFFWIPWVLFATAAPVVWWVKNRRIYKRGA